MHRFFLDSDAVWNTTLSIRDTQLLHQFTKVLRLGKWESVIFFDGKKQADFVYAVTQIEKKQFLFTLQEAKEKPSSLKNLHLFQALPNKLATLEEIVFFGTQVWYASFSFFPSHHAQPFFLSESKKERLRKIIIESAEQSGRNDIPPVYFLEHIPQSTGQNLLFHTNSQDAVYLENMGISHENPTNMYIGPEWGWSESEVQTFRENGFQVVTLRGNILRIVTAVVGVGFYFSQKM